MFDAFLAVILKMASSPFYSQSSTTPTYQILLRSNNTEKFTRFDGHFEIFSFIDDSLPILDISIS